MLHTAIAALLTFYRDAFDIVHIRLAIILTAMSMLNPHNAIASEIVFKDKAGRILTNDDLKKSTGTVKWEFLSQKPVPVEAHRLHQMGRKLAQGAARRKQGGAGCLRQGGEIGTRLALSAV